MEGNMSGKWKEKKNEKENNGNKMNKWEKNKSEITLKSAGVLYFGVNLLIISGKLVDFISGNIIFEHYIYIVVDLLCYVRCLNNLLVFVIVCLSWKPPQIPILLSARLVVRLLETEGPVSCEEPETQSFVLYHDLSLSFYTVWQEVASNRVAFKEAGGERYKLAVSFFC